MCSDAVSRWAGWVLSHPIPNGGQIMTTAASMKWAWKLYIYSGRGSLLQ